jgi:glucose uptake protein GlcU
MKNLLSILFLFLIIIGCSTTSRTIQKTENDSAKASKKSTAITIVYTLTFGAIGYFIGEKI